MPLTSKLIVYYTVLSQFYRSRVFTSKNTVITCHLIACIPHVFHFFAFTLKTISDVIGLNRLIGYRPTFRLKTYRTRLPEKRRN